MAPGHDRECRCPHILRPSEVDPSGMHPASHQSDLVGRFCFGWFGSVADRVVGGWCSTEWAIRTWPGLSEARGRRRQQHPPRCYRLPDRRPRRPVSPHSSSFSFLVSLPPHATLSDSSSLPTLIADDGSILGGSPGPRRSVHSRPPMRSCRRSSPT